MLLTLAINAFYVSTRPARADTGALYNDNLLIKLLYWPVILLAAVVVTLVFL